MRSHDLLLLPSLARHADLALLLMRLLVGSFLIWGVVDNILDAQDMLRFEQFLHKFGFPLPALMARVSVWAQFAVGVAFVLGWGTRWAGLVCAFNFIVALVMVDRHGGIRQMFPAAMLVAFGLYVACRGAGRYALEHRGRLSGPAEPAPARGSERP